MNILFAFLLGLANVGDGYILTLCHRPISIEVSTYKMNGDDAAEWCATKGKELWVPTREDEFDWRCGGGLPGDLWFNGKRDRTVKWGLIFRDNRGREINTRVEGKWDPSTNEPNDDRGIQNCVILFTSDNLLSDFQCSHQAYAGCVDKSVNDWKSQYVTLVHRQISFELSSRVMDENAAADWCEKRGKELWVPTREDKFEWKDGTLPGDLWINGKREDLIFKDNRGREINTRVEGKWDSYEPSLHGDCVVLFKSYNLLQTYWCNREYYAACVDKSVNDLKSQYVTQIQRQISIEISPYAMQEDAASDWCKIKNKELWVPTREDKFEWKDGSLPGDLWINAKRDNTMAGRVFKDNRGREINNRLSGKWHQNHRNGEQNCVALFKEVNLLGYQGCDKYLYAGCVDKSVNALGDKTCGKC